MFFMGPDLSSRSMGRALTQVKRAGAGRMMPGTPRLNVRLEHPMTLVEATATCFSRYATFSGRAARSEYWWWTLFIMLASLAILVASMAFGIQDASRLLGVFTLATLVPYLAVTSRRLHDIGKSGWWQLIYVVPLLGTILLIVWLARAGEGDNAFGPGMTV
jgi:uncharacterized membrane protein YhaH (DUF805 family)